MTTHKKKLCIIGAGNMAEALIKGILGADLYCSEDIVVTDIDRHRLEYFRNTYKINAESDNLAGINGTQVIIFAVKPQVLPQVLAEIKSAISENTLLISIVAGRTTHGIENALGKMVRVVRVMPNTPSLVGSGAAGFCAGSNTTADDMRQAESIFRCMGTIVELSEQLLDAVTALSGSGPAYIFYLVEAMLEAAEEMGLKNKEATKLIVATLKGSAKLLDESAETPEQLRTKVTSKGGTTEAAIQVLETTNVKQSFIQAIKAAKKRSEELSQ